MLYFTPSYDYRLETSSTDWVNISLSVNVASSLKSVLKKIEKVWDRGYFVYAFSTLHISYDQIIEMKAFLIKMPKIGDQTYFLSVVHTT